MATTKTNSRRSAVAKLAASKRFYPEKDTTELRREIAARKLEDAVRDIVENWPPLSPAQRDHIAGIIRNAPKHGDAA